MFFAPALAQNSSSGGISLEGNPPKGSSPGSDEMGGVVPFEPLRQFEQEAWALAAANLRAPPFKQRDKEPPFGWTQEEPDEEVAHKSRQGGRVMAHRVVKIAKLRSPEFAVEGHAGRVLLALASHAAGCKGSAGDPKNREWFGCYGETITHGQGVYGKPISVPLEGRVAAAHPLKPLPIHYRTGER